VTLPHSRKGSTPDGLLDDIVRVLDHQIAEYSSSLAKCKKDPQKKLKISIVCCVFLTTSQAMPPKFFDY